MGKGKGVGPQGNNYVHTAHTLGLKRLDVNWYALATREPDLDIQPFYLPLFTSSREEVYSETRLR